MSLLLHVALRSLRASPALTALAVLSVAAGVSFQVPNVANFRGYNAELVRVGLGRSAGHVLVQAPDGAAIPGASAIVRRISPLPFVRGALARLTHAALVLRSDGETPRPLRLVGVDPTSEAGVAGLCRAVASGACLASPAAQPEVVLGARLARDLQRGVGDTVKLVLPVDSLGELTTKTRQFRVAGVMAGAGGFPADEDAYVARSELTEALELDDAATEVSVFVDERDRAGEYAPRIEALTPGLQARAWLGTSFVAHAIAASEVLLRVSVTMVVAAVGVPILALFAIAVLRERRQIGVLAATGFAPRAIFAIYLLRALLSGLFGAALGACAAGALLRYFAHHPIFDHAGFAIRPIVDLRSFVAPIATVLAATLAASLVPAWFAARTNPIDTLRDE